MTFRRDYFGVTKAVFPFSETLARFLRTQTPLPSLEGWRTHHALCAVENPNSQGDGARGARTRLGENGNQTGRAEIILTWRRLGRAGKRGRNLEGGFLPNAATPKRTGRALRNSQFAIRNCQGFFSGFHFGMEDWGNWRLNLHHAVNSFPLDWHLLRFAHGKKHERPVEHEMRCRPRAVCY